MQALVMSSSVERIIWKGLILRVLPYMLCMVSVCVITIVASWCVGRSEVSAIVKVLHPRTLSLQVKYYPHGCVTTTMYM